jgi:hypothetical protein
MTHRIPLLLLALALASGLLWGSTCERAALAVASPDDPPTRAAPEFLLPVRLPEPVRQVRLRAYLYRLADELSDACADRHENPWGRMMRLRSFADAIATALEADWRTPMMLEDDWKFAATLVWIAHRETRIARNPAQLGDQDHGRAHGYWQVWQWHGRDPFAAETALDMLLTEPGSSWSLPRGAPWVGYPEAARFLEEHPFR